MYREKAKKLYKKAIWIHGDGRYATLSACGGNLTVMLHETPQNARDAMRDIDKLGCGGACVNKHWLVDLKEITT